MSRGNEQPAIDGERNRADRLTKVAVIHDLNFIARQRAGKNSTLANVDPSHEASTVIPHDSLGEIESRSCRW